MTTVTDALGRTVALAAPARRIVSLVPSETDSVARLGSLDRLVGRTRYCVEPAGIERVPEVGGTKDIDVDAVRRLEPDLVLANQEESSRHAVEALIEAGLPVHVSFPRTVPEALAYLRTLATLLGVTDPPALRAAEAAFARANTPTETARVFVPIWRDPWMTFDGNAFASDLLALVGAENVFADRPRRYPLAADLGRRAPLEGARVEGRDTRYPRIRLEEVVEREPELILLTDEPYAFGEEERAELEALGTGAKVIFASGQDLFWYGARLAESIERLGSLLRSARS